MFHEIFVARRAYREPVLRWVTSAGHWNVFPECLQLAAAVFRVMYSLGGDS